MDHQTRLPKAGYATTSITATTLSHLRAVGLSLIRSLDLSHFMGASNLGASGDLGNSREILRAPRSGLSVNQLQTKTESAVKTRPSC